MKFLIIFSILLAVCFGASVPSVNRKYCPQFCPTIFSPICAADGQQFRTFSNDCQLTAFNCWQSRDFKAVRSGQCEDSGSSVFDLMQETLSEDFVPIQKIPEQETLATKNCEPCTRIYLPVCGVDDGGEQRVFGNPCEINYVNCIESRKFVLLKDGEC